MLFNIANYKSLFDADFFYQPTRELKDNSYIYTFEMLGVDKEDVKIELNDDVLTVKVKNNVKYSVYVASQVDETKAESNLKNGILKVTLPLTKKTREIKVN